MISTVIADLYWVAEQKQISLNVEGLEASDADQLRADIREADLAAIVRNLVHNAVNYTQQGGSVCVRVENTPDKVRICVADTGPGIAPDERERVFDPFYRILGSSAPGTGLGLAICRAIVDKAAGSISLDWADPDKQRGLLATVELPRRRVL